MKLIVHNPDGLPVAKIKDFVPTQGELKDLTKDNYNKLLDSIEKHGFVGALFVWENKGKLHLLDGHQRYNVLNREAPNGEIPYIRIQAKNQADAMELLLKITSQYGKITQEGVDAFIATYDLPESEMYQAVHFDALPFLDTIDSVEHISADKDFLSDSDDYANNNVNQIVLIYDNAEYNEVMSNLNAILGNDDTIASSPSELFKLLVGEHANRIRK